MIARITSKGQLTIPKRVRDRMGLHAGDRVEFTLEKDNTARMVPVNASIKELKGFLPKPRKAVRLEDMQEAIEKEAVENDRY